MDVFQGCDASLLLQGKNSEQNAGVSNHLHAGALRLIESVRAEAHRQCGPTVSCADITALGAREAVAATGGPAYAVNLGQLDSLAPASPDEWFDLPGAWDPNYTTLLASYSRWKLNGVHVVALSGAHTIGSSACLGFYDRFRRWDTNFDRQIGEECERRKKILCRSPVNRRFTPLPGFLPPVPFHRSQSSMGPQRTSLWLPASAARAHVGFAEPSSRRPYRERTAPARLPWSRCPRRRRSAWNLDTLIADAQP
ncbi:hypothetical protein EJB05_30561, partial [Eragrostis curvula]